MLFRCPNSIRLYAPNILSHLGRHLHTFSNHHHVGILKVTILSKPDCCLCRIAEFSVSRIVRQLIDRHNLAAGSVRLVLDHGEDNGEVDLIEGEEQQPCFIFVLL